MKKIIILLTILLLLLVLRGKKNPESLVCFSNNCIQAEIAATEKERQKGLMFRKSLPENQGMFFVFNKADLHSFWMKNTYIPLDIIWIDENHKVVHIEQAVPCQDECISYQPEKPAKYILEVNTGSAEDIHIGDKVEIHLTNMR